MITIILFLLSWIIVGILSYGLAKNNMKQLEDEIRSIERRTEEFLSSTTQRPIGRG